MKVMLNVLAIIGLVATTTAITELNIDEYGTEALERVNKDLLKESVKEAKLINPDVELQYQRTTDFNHPLVVQLSPVSFPDPKEQEQDVCAGFHGIDLNNGEKHICQITHFGVEVMEDMNHVHIKPLIRFFVSFDAESTDSIILEVPVFLIPKSLASTNEDELKAWAEKEEVGLISPLDLQKLSDTIEKKTITLNFGWLNTLLNHKITERSQRRQLDFERETITPTYVTRPIVVSEDIKNKLIDLASDQFQTVWFYHTSGQIKQQEE